jgi:hypothetical protein
LEVADRLRAWAKARVVAGLQGKVNFTQLGVGLYVLGPGEPID